MAHDNSSDVRTSVQIHNNGVKKSQQQQQQQLQYQPCTNNSAINQTIYNNKQHQFKASFIKFFNPFGKSAKSQATASEEAKKPGDSSQLHESKKSVKVLKQFWNEQIKTAKSSEHLDCSDPPRKSATLKYFSQSNDNLIDSNKYHHPPTNRAEKSLTLDGNLRLPLDDFNKFKDANFIRNKKIKLLSTNGGGGGECNAHKHKLESNVIKPQQQQQQRHQRYSLRGVESLNDSHFPQVSATGGKLHWAKRDDILLAKKSTPVEISSINNRHSVAIMSVKTNNKVNASSASDGAGGSGKGTQIPENGSTSTSTNNKSTKACEQQKTRSARGSDSMTSSMASSITSTGSASGGANRKFSFKTNPATTSAYMNKKHASGAGGSVSKVAQIAQRFNQMIQQDASILEEVKKRGGVVVHRAGNRVFKIKEERAGEKTSAKRMASGDDAASNVSDDAISLVSMGKNSTRRKSTLRKRPSIRIMVESPRKDGNGNVLSKRQLYEANVINKETIVLKPKVPDKSERVLAKTKELKSKKLLLYELLKTEPKSASTNEASSGEQLPKIDEAIAMTTTEAAPSPIEPVKDATSKNNFRKIYDKITFRPTFLYGKKATKAAAAADSPPQKSIIEAAAAEATVNNSETEATAESNKANNDDTAINEVAAEDEFELEPIDLNLNVYFNNENLSNNASPPNVDEENVSSQGPPTTDDTIASANTKPDKQQPTDVKPNSSFLFRAQPSTKFDSACDTFMRGMLNGTSLPPSLHETEIADEPNQLTSAHEQQQEENDYEIIAKDFHESKLAEGEAAAAAAMIRRAENGGDIDAASDTVGGRENENDDDDGAKEEEEEEEENIYQSLCEVKGEQSDAMSDKSYESFENYDEIKQSILDNRINLSDILRSEDDYIVPDTSLPPELPAPRKNTVPKISSPILTSTTSNLVQANFPVPKQATGGGELHKSNSCLSTTYERIKYDQLPQPKQQHSHHGPANVELPLPPRNNQHCKQQQHQQKHQQRDENIYDTIKNYSSSRSGGGDAHSISTEYENISDITENDKNASGACEQVKLRRESESFADSDDNPYKNSKNDTMSIISNCYESISLKQSYSTINQILRHAISTTTLSSEHRINSIYGIGQSLTPPSDRSGGGSDNSDEWIDVESEEEEEDEAENNDRFIVICKKTKTHRNPPDWSRLIRQKLDEWDVFVSSKSCIYITPNDSKLITSSNANRVDASELPLFGGGEPIYENIERDDDGNNIVPSDNNKFTIYVNYDFIKKGEKKCSKSSVRLLEPDVQLVHKNEDGDIHHANSDDGDDKFRDDSNGNASGDNDEENNNGKSTSKMIQCQQISMYIDDSDHHYESLYSIQQQRAALEGKLESEKPLGLDNSSSNQSYFIDKFDDDDYSSFDSDDEDEKHEEKHADIRNAKLPDPPLAANAANASGQVYAIVQRLKNFGSISKIEITKGFSKITKKRSSLGKIPTSKFYETTDIAEDVTPATTPTAEYAAPKYESKSVGKKSRGLAKLSKLGRLTINKLPANFNLSEPPFDQSDYAAAKATHNESNSSLNKLSSHAVDNDVEFQNLKNNKSFKAKFRKSSTPSLTSASTSNIYSSLASKNSSTFYVTDSLDVDSGIFAVNEKSTSSPDNSNLNLNASSNSSISCDPKRRSIAAITSSSRPKDSPPPPPSERTRRSGTTSWYAECGLFKTNASTGESDEKGDKVISSSWYQESGLYQTSNNSVASSSGSSGVSTGGECSPCGDENSHSMFLNEPLYQLYTAAKLESISSSEFEPETESSDGYEEIHKKDLQEAHAKKPSRPSALQLIEPNHGPSRTLWSEVHEVIQSGMLSSLQTNEKKLQEAKFEILTSEASYLKSLNLLRSHFMNHPAFRDPQTLDPQDRKILFANIIPVQECADRLLCDLESCWQDSIMLRNLAKHIFKHAEKHFHVYIAYCEHQGRLDRTLKRLKETNAPFKEALDILENDPLCCGLTIHSFLMLPMQRITRLPLLIDAVMTKLKSNDDEFDDWKMAMAIANKIVDQCNQAANRCEQAFEMETLSKQIEFQQTITPFPLIPFSTTNGGSNRLTRTLVKRGELTHIIYRGDDAKLTFGKKATVKKNIYCFLFTDVILLTKKKSEESFVVFDYCQRSLLQVSSGDVIPQFPTKEINHAGKYVMFMSLLENHSGKPVDLILACPSETERQRWLQATSPPTSENPYETLYEQWDCPQVVVKHAYKPIEPDELTLEVGDVVNVLRKMKDDGWYYGERIRDGAQGWFPGNFSMEVHSAHVRARNLKQRHRLLLYTATYLESQKDVNIKRK